MNIFERITKKPFGILIEIYNNKDINSSEIARARNMQYSHCYKMIKRLKTEGFFNVKIDKRRYMFNLTDKGMEITKHLVEIEKGLKDALLLD